MKRLYRGFPVFVWALLGLLALSAALLSLGARDDSSDPAADSFGPSGTAALVQLLRTQGYDVRIDRWPRPRLSPGDVAIECATDASRITGGGSSDFFKYMTDEVQQGVNVVDLEMPTNFLQLSRHVLESGPVAVQPRGQTKPMEICVGDAIRSQQAALLWAEDGVPQVGLWDIGQTSFLRAFRWGSGTLLTVGNGMFATNRFIDRGDDARAAVRIVGMLAHPGGHVVFTEAAHGEIVPPSLMETIGPWAYAGWQQLLVLVVVIIYTLGKRFGIPEEARPTQRGARELLDAMADTFYRGRQTRVAMQSNLDRVEVSLRRALNLPRDASFEDLVDDLPSELAGSLLALREACLDEATRRPPEALALIAKARDAAEAFLLGRRSPALSR